MDNKGVHFYNHAQISERVFKSIFKNKLATELISQDMLFHKTSCSNIKELKKERHWVILAIAAIAEFNANCSLFGGKDSVNYKIKKKQMESKLKKLFKA